MVNRTIIRQRCGTEEISRNSQIMFDKDIDLPNIDFASLLFQDHT